MSVSEDVALADERSATPWSELHYDHRSSKVAVDPWDLWRTLRAECPVLFSDRYGGMWFVSRHEDVNRILVEWETFSAAQGTNIPDQGMPLLPIDSDPPLHRQYRSIINPALAPQRVAEHASWIRVEAIRQLDKLDGRTEFDLVHDYCEAYAKRVALRVIGFAEQDLDKLDHWTHILSTGPRDDENGAIVFGEFYAFLRETLVQRSTEPGSDDLITLVVQGDVGGRQLTIDEQTSMLMLLTFGGLDTTGNVLAGALIWLSSHPEDRHALTAKPELMSTAIDEFVRFVSPVTHMRRTTARDTEIGGCPIPEGERILFGIGSANHDERVFDQPDDVVLDRYPNPHFGFGAGPHRCIGSHLGKLAVRIGLEEFMARYRAFEADHNEIRFEGGEGRHIAACPMTVVAR